MQEYDESRDIDVSRRAPWGSRVAAGLIDWELIGAVVFSFFFYLGWIGITNLFLIWTIDAIIFWVILGVIYVIYFAAFESVFGASIGKGCTSLEVLALDGDMTFGKAAARNLSKIHFILFIIDRL